MESAYKERLEKFCKTNLAAVEESEIRFFYKEIFGEEFKKNCGTCIDDAFYKIVRYAKQNNMVTKQEKKYRFTKAWEKKTVVVTIGGTSHVVTADNLSVATAEAILNSSRYRKDIIELNPNYTGASDEVKKNTVLNQPEPMPILSISPEVLSVGETSEENVSEKESDIAESKPLTEVVKKQEPAKKSKGAKGHKK